jgi:hypothetical protein
LVFYEPESIGVTKHSAVVGWTTSAIAFGYMALSVYTALGEQCSVRIAYELLDQL